ncbi:PREDICTED: C-C chemokine receptor type 5-like [Gekko japonicus]|uniref:C-C chemokine receptor type 5-like n=1 Tax=Gekko japonicus TaxID=146911 RepID=A0ABM1K251_GEKJA|nr:PREDICTED: C-C chemokine receptor type 5-like [Gekko japonicus]XP_015267795.1 PREDICTED: C-C chemokine receptor type 5-like [Gekko japonicus]
MDSSIKTTMFYDDDSPSITMATAYDYDGAPSPVEDLASQKFNSHVMPTLYSLVFVFGLLGNALVVLILILFKKLKSMTDIYLLNLAISDLLFIVSLPFWAYAAGNEWVFENTMCKILSAAYDTGFYSGSFFIILLTIDRYLAIVHAVFAMKARTAVYGMFSSGFTWLLAVIASVPTLMFSEVQKRKEGQRCSLRMEEGRKLKEFLVLMRVILGLVIPFLIMLVCYVQILMILMKNRNDKKLKAIRLIFVIMVIFFIFWVPYNATLLLVTFSPCTEDCADSFGVEIQVTETIAMIHCCINPVIYAFVGEKFRKYLSVLFRKCTKMCRCRLCVGVALPSLERSFSSMSTSEHDISTGL